MTAAGYTASKISDTYNKSGVLTNQSYTPTMLVATGHLYKSYNNVMGSANVVSIVLATFVQFNPDADAENEVRLLLQGLKVNLNFDVHCLPGKSNGIYYQILIQKTGTATYAGGLRETGLYRLEYYITRAHEPSMHDEMIATFRAKFQLAEKGELKSIDPIQ